MRKKISIIIVTFNSESHIYDCLSSIFVNNDIGDSVQVIIVDNGSKNVNEMFHEIARLYGDFVLLIKNKSNLGYGSGNNLGVKNAIAPIVMVMNPDVRLISPIFGKVLAKFEDRNITMLGIKQMYSLSKASISFFPVENVNSLLSIMKRNFYNKYDIYTNGMAISGACFFVRKSSFVEAGMFDEKIFLYAEERDLFIRISKNINNKIVFDKTMKYIHLASNRGFSLQQSKLILKSGLYLCEKFGLSKRLYFRNEIYSVKIRIFILWIKGEDITLHKEYLRYLTAMYNSLK